MYVHVNYINILNAHFLLFLLAKSCWKKKSSLIMCAWPLPTFCFWQNATTVPLVVLAVVHLKIDQLFAFGFRHSSIQEQKLGRLRFHFRDLKKLQRVDSGSSKSTESTSEPSEPPTKKPRTDEPEDLW